jgi:adenylate cyclase class IV
LRALGITPSTTESRLLDGQDFEKEDQVVGTVVGRMWLCGIDDELDFAFSDHFEQEDATFLKGCSDVKAGDKLLRMSLWSKDQESPTAWRAEHLWGFEAVEEESIEPEKASAGRRYARRIVVRKGDEVERARMVYDFVSGS